MEKLRKSHHISVGAYPDHFHDVDGKIRPSYLSGNSLKDLDKVLNVIKNYIAVG